MLRKLLAIFCVHALILVSNISVADVVIDKTSGLDAPPPMIAASPARLTLEIDKKAANGSVRLFNLGNEPITVNTTVAHWDLDDNNEVRVIPPTPQSLDQWMIINPVIFTIPPKKSQTIRLSIRPRAIPVPGEHRGIIFFDQQLPQDAPSKTVRIKFRLGIVVYGLSGDIARDGQLHSIRLAQKNNLIDLSFDISSTGNAGIRLDGQYSIWPKDKFPGAKNVPMYRLKAKDSDVPDFVQAGDLASTPVLPGTRRTIKQTIPVPDKPDEYIVLVKGNLGGVSFSRMSNISQR